MEKEDLCNLLKERLWQVNKLEITAALRDFTEGETAALACLYKEGEQMTPSQISDSLNISRARITCILTTLRKKELVVMEMSAEDRRKMLVKLTAKGREVMSEKLSRLDSLLAIYVDAVGSGSAEQLAEILKKAVDCHDDVMKKFNAASLPD